MQAKELIEILSKFPEAHISALDEKGGEFQTAPAMVLSTTASGMRSSSWKWSLSPSFLAR